MSEAAMTLDDRRKGGGEGEGGTKQRMTFDNIPWFLIGFFLYISHL